MYVHAHIHALHVITYMYIVTTLNANLHLVIYIGSLVLDPRILAYSAVVL